MPNAFGACADGQLLMVPAAFAQEGTPSYPHMVQSITGPLLSDMIAAAVASQNWAFGWNSLGAGASQNHVHVHAVRCRYPIQDAPRVKIGKYFFPYGWACGCLGLEPSDPEAVWAAWNIIDRLQRLGIPFNILLTNDAVLITARRKAGLVQEFPCGILAFSELAGRVLVSDFDVFSSLNEGLISTAIKKTTLPLEELFEIL